VDRLAEALRFTESLCDFRPSLVVIDGFDFDGEAAGILDGLHRIASDSGAEIWMSATIAREPRRNETGIPEPLSPLETRLEVILEMAHDGERIRVRLLKDHSGERSADLDLSMDPTTRLLVRT
jgi:hypothetical protein